MMAYKVFWVAGVILLAASYLFNGGFFGKLFRNIQNYAMADRFLFLAASDLLMCLVALYQEVT